MHGNTTHAMHMSTKRSIFKNCEDIRMEMTLNVSSFGGDNGSLQLMHEPLENVNVTVHTDWQNVTNIAVQRSQETRLTSMSSLLSLLVM